MSDSWKQREEALENQYFDKANKEALERLQKVHQIKSPVTGSPMEKIVFLGAVIDWCKESDGIWLDKGELEYFIETIKRDRRSADEIANELKSIKHRS